MKTARETLTVASIELTLARLRRIDQDMTYLQPPPPEERKLRKERTNPKNLEFLRNRVHNAKKNRKLIPASIDLVKLEENAALTFALSEYLAFLRNMQAKVEDSLLHVGNQAYVTAAATHTHIKVASALTETRKPTKKSRRRRSAPTVAAIPQVSAVPAAPIIAITRRPLKQLT